MSSRNGKLKQHISNGATGNAPGAILALLLYLFPQVEWSVVIGAVVAVLATIGLTPEGVLRRFARWAGILPDGRNGGTTK